jgi:hypothetical protein
LWHLIEKSSLGRPNRNARSPPDRASSRIHATVLVFAKVRRIVVFVSADRLLRTLVRDGLSQNPDFPIIS